MHCIAKASFNTTKALFISKLNLNLRKKLVNCYIWSVASYSTETWTLRKADHKYLESFEMQCRRRKEQVSWTGHMRNEVWQRVKKERNILRTIKTRKGNWIGLTMRRRRLLKHATEGKTQERIEVRGKRVRWRKKLLDGLNEKTGYWKMKEETLDRTLWRTRFGRGRKRKEWIVKHLKYKNRIVYWFLYVTFILSRYHYFVQDACLFFILINAFRFQFVVKRRLHWAYMTKSSLWDVQTGIQISPRAVERCRRWNIRKTTKSGAPNLAAFCT